MRDLLIEDMSISPKVAAHFLGLSQYVEKDPERLGGEPVFRGTRVPVRSLFDHLAAGDSLERFLQDFPGVQRQQALAVIQAVN